MQFGDIRITDPEVFIQVSYSPLQKLTRLSHRGDVKKSIG